MHSKANQHHTRTLIWNTQESKEPEENRDREELDRYTMVVGSISGGAYSFFLHHVPTQIIQRTKLYYVRDSSKCTARTTGEREYRTQCANIFV